MITLSKNSLAIASALAISTFAASAATVSTVTIVETTRDFGGTVTTDVTTDTIDDGDVSITAGRDSVATQNEDGTSVVRATVGFVDREELTTSTAAFKQSETNTFGMDRDYTLNYTLAEQSAQMFWDNGECCFETARVAAFSTVAPTNPDNPFGEEPNTLPGMTIDVTAASFEYGISVDGVEIFAARADAIMDGFGVINVVTDAVSGFTPMITGNGFGGVTFTVAPLSGSIFLGTYAAGDEIIVDSFLRARAYTTGFVEIGGSVDVFSSDPISLSSVGFLTSDPTDPGVPPVPLPAAGWLLMAGLGGLAAARRRKS
jgi:hypothetical protein